jgi:hypothetical protein
MNFRRFPGFFHFMVFFPKNGKPILHAQTGWLAKIAPASQPLT